MDASRVFCVSFVVLALSLVPFSTPVEGLPRSGGTRSASPQDSFAGLLAILNPLGSGGTGGYQRGSSLAREMLGDSAKPRSGRGEPLVPPPPPSPPSPFRQGQKTGQTCAKPCRFGAECCLLKPGRSQPYCAPMSLTSCHWSHCIQNKTHIPPPSQAIFGDGCPCMLGSCCYNRNGNRYEEPFDGYCSFNG